MHAQNTSVDSRELERARRGWATFARFTFYAVVHMVVLLILMVVFLL